MSVGTAARETRAPVLGYGASRARPLFEPEAFAVLAFTVLAAAVRFVRIGHQGFWFDEANTALLVHFSAGKMLGLLPQSESTPPLYYCLAWVWARIFGFGEAGLRSLSALVGVLTVPVAYLVGLKLLSRRAGVIVAALTACNPLLIWYSQEARSYSLLVFMTAVSLLAFAYARERPAQRNLLAWVLASALALATHYYAALVVVPLAAWLLVEHRRLRRVQVAVAALAACGLALLPLATAQNATGNASWIAAIPPWWRFKQIVPQFLVGYQAPVQGFLERTCEAIALLSVVLLVVRAAAVERRGALAMGAVAAAGFALNLLLIAVGIDDLITRNVIALWLPAALMVAGGLATMAPPRRPSLGSRPRGRLGLARRSGAGVRRPLALIGVLGATVLCVSGIAGAVGTATNRGFQRPDWRGVARLLGRRQPSGTSRAILIQHYRDLLPLSLYEPGLRFMKADGATVQEFDVVSFTAPRVHLCVWGAACNLSGTRMQRAYRLKGFRVLWRRHIYQFTVLHMVSSQPLRLTPGAVSRALTSTRLAKDELLIQR